MGPKIRSKPDALPAPRPIRDGFRLREGIVLLSRQLRAASWTAWTCASSRGERIALIGENGQGKTTIVKLLTRLYDPTCGPHSAGRRGPARLQHGGPAQPDRRDLSGFHALRNDGAAEHRGRAGSMRRGGAAIRRPRARAWPTQVIERLPSGYEQLLGRRFEGGVDLSGGEWQKIALARAYLRDAQMLILDEPTASAGRALRVRSVPTFRRTDRGQNGAADLAPFFHGAHGGPDRGSGKRPDRRTGKSRAAHRLWAAGTPACSSCRHRATDDTGTLTAEMSGQPARESDVSASHRSGQEQLAESIYGDAAARQASGQTPCEARQSAIMARARAAPDENRRAWLLDNFRLIHSAAKAAVRFRWRLPCVSRGARPVRQRVPASACLRETISKRAATLHGRLTLRCFPGGLPGGDRAPDGRNLGPQACARARILIDWLTRPTPDQWPELCDQPAARRRDGLEGSLRSVSLVDRVLARDPAGAYARMDFESRDRYRKAIAELAKHGAQTEQEVAEAAMDLAREAAELSPTARGGRAPQHVGYYWWIAGARSLRAASATGRLWRARLRAILRHPTAFYLAGIELLTLAIVGILIAGLDTFTPRLMPVCCCCFAGHTGRGGFHEQPGDAS